MKTRGIFTLWFLAELPLAGAVSSVAKCLSSPTVYTCAFASSSQKHKTLQTKICGTMISLKFHRKATYLATHIKSRSTRSDSFTLFSMGTPLRHKPPLLTLLIAAQCNQRSGTSTKTISGTFTTLGDYTPLNSHRCPLFFCAQFCTSSKVFTRGPYSPLSLYTAEFAKVKSVQIQAHEGKQKLLLPPV